jgi:hypothetical protein
VTFMAKAKLGLPVVAVAMTLVFTGCGGDVNSNFKPGSCMETAANICVQWSTGYSETPASGCAAMGGTYSGGVCDPANRVGRCVINYAGPLGIGYFIQWTFYGGTVAIDQDLCTQAAEPGVSTTTWAPG